MNHLLKAMGFWIWGLVAIGLSVSVASVSYRMLSLYQSHELASRSTSEIGSDVDVASPPALHRRLAPTRDCCHRSDCGA